MKRPAPSREARKKNEFEAFAVPFGMMMLLAMIVMASSASDAGRHRGRQDAARFRNAARLRHAIRADGR